MSNGFKHLLFVHWMWMCLISAMPVYSDNCSAFTKTERENHASWGDSCRCLRNRSNKDIIVCSEWSLEPFSYQVSLDRLHNPNNPAVEINGLNGTIPLKFLEWFVPQVMIAEKYVTHFDISNFCNDSSKIRNHLNLSEIFTPQSLNFVTSLKMSHNCLHSITGSVAPRYPIEFRELDLSFNKFPRVPKFIEIVYALTNYDLSYNNISTVSFNDFNRTFRLEQLNLSHNNLSSLPKDLLFGMKILEVLDLSHNSILSIPMAFLSENLLLSKFDINNNKLTEIDDSCFAYSKTIMEIDLSHNKLQTLSLSLWNLRRLEVLRLDSNNIIAFQFYGVVECHNLKVLTFNNNSLIRTSKLLTQYVSDITYDLSNNAFEDVEIPPTTYIQNAETLDMSNNCVKKFIYRASKHSGEHIRNYKCSNCCIHSIENHMFDKVTNKVNISFNKISKLNELDLKKFQNIPQIILSHNKISHVNLKHFVNNYKGSTKLVYFDLSYNPFVCDCRLAGFIKYLRNQNETFTFKTQNNFCSFPPEMKNVSLVSIDNLFCEYPKNCPASCHCNVDDLDNIPYVSIKCSNSNLTHFPKIHTYGSSVAVHLNLTHNKINSLPDKNDPIWLVLRILDLSFNQLKSLKNMTITPSLTKLYLNNNFLTEFDATIASLSHLSEISLANNPWICDCEMSKFVVKSRVFDEKYEWLCAIENKIYNFTDIDQICKKFNLLWLLLPVITLVILLSVIVIFCIKYKSEILYYMFSKGICLRFVSEEDVDADKAYDAFVSYANEDEEWIVDFLVPGLETEVPSYKLCLHNRDWRAGEFITDQIVRSVESSKRTIIVLTDSYLNSQWSRLEFDIAYQQGLKDKVRRVIAVVPDEVPNLSKIDQEFKSFITLTTYIEAKKLYFWTKLRASMPRTKNTLVPENKRQTTYLNASYAENSA